MKPILYIVSMILTSALFMACSDSGSPDPDPDSNSDGPSIDTVTGDFQDGRTITISGSGFGADAVEYKDSSVGPNGFIEQEPVGTAFNDKGPYWRNNYSGIARTSDISNTKAWSGSKSIDCTINQAVYGETDSGRGFWWSPSFPSGEFKAPGGENNWTSNRQFEKFYFTFWSWDRPDHSTTSYRLGGKYYGWSSNFWHSNDGACSAAYHARGWYPDGSQHTDEATSMVDGRSQQMNVSWGTPESQWYREEVYVESNSAQDVYDGTVKIYRYVPGQGRTLHAYWPDNAIWNSWNCDARYSSKPRFLHWMNYRDQRENGTGEIWEQYMDDIYIQTGTWAHVELGDAPLMENVTTLEVQNATSWSDTSIDVELNYGGSFSAGDTAYVFIIEDGDVPTTGYPIVLE